MPRRPSSLEEARRIDLRFLLPDPRLGDVALIGPADDALRAALRADAGSVVVEPEPNAGAIFDLVIVRGATPGRLRRAATLARGDGWIMVEEERPWRGIGRRLRSVARQGPEELVRRAGLRVERVSWHWPGLSASTEIVPLNDRPALRLFLARRRSDRQARFKVLLVRVLARTGLLAHLVSGLSVLARPSQATRPASARDDTPREPFGGLLVTPRFRASRHVVRLMPTPDGGVARVEKVARRSGDGGGLAREVAALTTAAAVPDLTGTVPLILGSDLEASHPRLAETGLAGRPVGRGDVREDAPALVDATVEWLLALPRGSSVPGNRFVRDALARLAEACVGHPNVATLVDRTASILRGLTATSLPTVLEHGDAAPPNLYRLPDGRIGAVDWELAHVDGLPGQDLLFFLAYVGTASTSAGIEDEVAFRLTFSDPEVRLRDQVARYANDLGLPGTVLPGIFVATWLRWADRQVARLTDAGGDALAELLPTRHVQRWRVAVELAEEGRLAWLEALGA